MIGKIKYCMLVAAAMLSMDALAGTSSYGEPKDTSKVELSCWQKKGKKLEMGWVDGDRHYRRYASAPQLRTADTLLTVWRGERIGVEALIVSRKDSKPMKVELSDFTDSNGKKVEMPGAKAMFMRYVWGNDVRACGYQSDTVPAYTIADMIDLQGTVCTVEAQSVRPVWCTVEVPSDLVPGIYHSELKLVTAKGNKTVASIGLDIEVLDRKLPAPSDYGFYLDLWQQPYAISRYYGVEPWSAEHLELLRPYAEYMARVGQKAVTTILFYEPWGEQSNDKFEPMVQTSRNADDSWEFDFTIFDRYVDFMAEYDIDTAIECFTMVPWEMKFRYFDKNAGEYRFLEAITSSDEYKELWTAMLTSLAEHLRTKGWFEKTYIFMDERSLDQMKDAVRVAREAVPDFKMGLAGNYHAELVDLLESYTLGAGTTFSAEEFEKRREKNMISLVYTCCANPAPSQFVSNDPDDGTYLPVYATAAGFDGYLHWSFQNWNNDPMRDTRFFLFGAGDTFFIYPDGRSSVRYERFAEGVQLSEKIRVLREDFEASGDIEGLKALENAIAPIRSNAMSNAVPSSMIINDLRKEIAELSR